MQRFKNILCIVEHGADSSPALKRAIALAETNQARLKVITVIPFITAGIDMPESAPVSIELQDKLLSISKEKLEQLVSPYRQNMEIETRTLVGISFLETVREVIRNSHDLVIKCPETLSWMERFFTSDDMQLLRKCPCPVWLTNTETEGPYKRILAAVDVDDSYPPEELATRHALNKSVMELASSLAISEFAELHVAHAWEVIGESALRHSIFMELPEEKVNAHVASVHKHHAQLLDELISEFSAELGRDSVDYIKPQLHMLKGAARKEIPALAKKLNADCIVMGTVGRTGIPGLLIGNTAENILGQIECSVIAIKPPGFVTTVTAED